MKELTIQEKAKRYDDALERARDFMNGEVHYALKRGENIMCWIFSELRESEDERIRKNLITFFKNEYGTNSNARFAGIKVKGIITWLEKQKPNYCHHEVDLSDCSEEYRKAYYDGWNNCNMQHSQCKSELDDVVKCLINGMKFYYEDNEEATWGTDKWSMPVKHIIEVLEKQGEQKPADNAEPKFEIGDLITNGVLVGKIDRIYDWGYHVYFGDYYSDVPDVENWHKWTIQDAKDGDVLFTSSTASHETFILKSIDEKGNAKCYFAYDSEDGFREGKYHFIGSATNCKPATKEQRDTLFAKMKEAGYEWDADKKELKKIDTYCQENCKGFQETGKCFCDGECKAKKEYIKHKDKQKQDVSIQINPSDYINDMGGNGCYLKNTAQASAWSEEDEEIVEALNVYVKNLDIFFSEIKIGDKNIIAKEFRRKVQSWLKSLKDRV